MISQNALEKKSLSFHSSVSTHFIRYSCKQCECCDEFAIVVLAADIRPSGRRSQGLCHGC